MGQEHLSLQRTSKSSSSHHGSRRKNRERSRDREREREREQSRDRDRDRERERERERERDRERERGRERERVGDWPSEKQVDSHPQVGVLRCTPVALINMASMLKKKKEQKHNYCIMFNARAVKDPATS